MQVAEQTAAARHEAKLAAAAVAGLAFEDKLKLLTALQPEPLTALVGALFTSPGNPILAEDSLAALMAAKCGQDSRHDPVLELLPRQDAASLLAYEALPP